MKRFFILFLILLPFVSVSFAETLSIDLNTASLDELVNVRDAVDKRIESIKVSMIRSDEKETHTITGNGTKILDGIAIKVPSRFVATCSEDTRVTWYVAGDDKPHTYGEYGESQSCYSEIIGKPITLTSIMVESQGDWNLEFSPIGVMDSPDVSGIGSYVSDRFVITPPCMVSITLEGTGVAGYGGLCSVYLYSISKNGKLKTETFVDWGTNVFDTESFDFIIKPEKDIISYFWKVNCSTDVKWSISAK